MPKEQSLHELAGDLILPVINLIEQGQSFVVDVTRPSKRSERPAKKAATEEQKCFVVDVTRPDKPSKRPAKNNLLSRILTGGFY